MCISIIHKWMSRNFLFQSNHFPSNWQLIDNSDGSKRLLATKFNSERNQIAHLLIASLNATTPTLTFNYYSLYNWNITSNIISLNFQTIDWNCTVRCEISASATFFLIEDHLNSNLYLLDSSLIVSQVVLSQRKNKIPILVQSSEIRKKSDISKNRYVYCSGKDILALSYVNGSLIQNLFPIPLIYNFNPNNFVLDTKLYQNTLYVLYRSIVTYNIYLYSFQKVQQLFQQYPNNTQLNATVVGIYESFRFNNNYITKVIRFVRGFDSITGKQVIWAYNDNEAYKCCNSPCIGYGYEIYNNIVFSSVTSTNYLITFYGKSPLIELKSFKPSLVSQQFGQFVFNSTVNGVEMIAYANYTVNKLLVTQTGQLFPTVYKVVNDCRPILGTQINNFCVCRSPYYYNSSRSNCMKTSEQQLDHLSTLYIAFIAICSVLILTLIFIIYKKIISLQRVRKSWHYNAAENIIFE